MLSQVFMLTPDLAIIKGPIISARPTWDHFHLRHLDHPTSENWLTVSGKSEPSARTKFAPILIEEVIVPVRLKRLVGMGEQQQGNPRLGEVVVVSTECCAIIDTVS